MSAPGTSRRFAAVRRFGRDRSEADMPRASGAGRSDQNDPDCVKTPRGITAPWNFRLYGHAENKKTQKFVFRSASRPNQISFSHDQDPSATSAAYFAAMHNSA